MLTRNEFEWRMNLVTPYSFVILCDLNRDSTVEDITHLRLWSDHQGLISLNYISLLSATLLEIWNCSDSYVLVSGGKGDFVHSDEEVGGVCDVVHTRQSIWFMLK